MSDGKLYLEMGFARLGKQRELHVRLCAMAAAASTSSTTWTMHKRLLGPWIACADFGLGRRGAEQPLEGSKFASVMGGTAAPVVTSTQQMAAVLQQWRRQWRQRRQVAAVVAVVAAVAAEGAAEAATAAAATAVRACAAVAPRSTAVACAATGAGARLVARVLCCMLGLSVSAVAS